MSPGHRRLCGARTNCPEPPQAIIGSGNTNVAFHNAASGLDGTFRRYGSAGTRHPSASRPMSCSPSWARHRTSPHVTARHRTSPHVTASTLHALREDIKHPLNWRRHAVDNRVNTAEYTKAVLMTVAAEVGSAPESAAAGRLEGVSRGLASLAQQVETIVNKRMAALRPRDWRASMRRSS